MSVSTVQGRARDHGDRTSNPDNLLYLLSHCRSLFMDFIDTACTALKMLLTLKNEEQTKQKLDIHKKMEGSSMCNYGFGSIRESKALPVRTCGCNHAVQTGGGEALAGCHCVCLLATSANYLNQVFSITEIDIALQKTFIQWIHCLQNKLFCQPLIISGLISKIKPQS